VDVAGCASRRACERGGGLFRERPQGLNLFKFYVYVFVNEAGLGEILLRRQLVRIDRLFLLISGWILILNIIVLIIFDFLIG
jgi:hypothetical protein